MQRNTLGRQNGNGIDVQRSMRHAKPVDVAAMLQLYLDFFNDQDANSGRFDCEIVIKEREERGRRTAIRAGDD